MCGFCKKKYRKNNHVKIVSLFLSHYLKIEKYQKILVQYIEKLAKEKSNGLGNNLIYQAIIDTKNNHFQLVELGWHEKRYIHDVLIHLDINSETGNIWIQKK